MINIEGTYPMSDIHKLGPGEAVWGGGWSLWWLTQGETCPPGVQQFLEPHVPLHMNEMIPLPPPWNITTFHLLSLGTMVYSFLFTMCIDSFISLNYIFVFHMFINNFKTFSFVTLKKYGHKTYQESVSATTATASATGWWNVGLCAVVWRSCLSVSSHWCVCVVAWTTNTEE